MQPRAEDAPDRGGDAGRFGARRFDALGFARWWIGKEHSRSHCTCTGTLPYGLKDAPTLCFGGGPTRALRSVDRPGNQWETGWHRRWVDERVVVNMQGPFERVLYQPSSSPRPHISRPCPRTTRQRARFVAGIRGGISDTRHRMQTCVVYSTHTASSHMLNELASFSPEDNAGFFLKAWRMNVTLVSPPAGDFAMSRIAMPRFPVQTIDQRVVHRDSRTPRTISDERW